MFLYNRAITTNTPKKKTKKKTDKLTQTLGEEDLPSLLFSVSLNLSVMFDVVSFLFAERQFKILCYFVF